PAYKIYVFQLHLSMIKRSVGLFAGFALIFIGTSVAFYTLKNETTLEGEAAGTSAKLNTASPGIIAMVLGVVLITFTVQSKDTFPSPSFSEPSQPVHVPTAVPQ